MPSVRPGRCGELLSILKQANRIPLAQSEIKVDCFFQNQKCTRIQNGSLRKWCGFSLRFSFFALIIGQIPSGDVHRRRADVGDLHPVIALIRSI